MKIYEWNILFDRFKSGKICVSSKYSGEYKDLFDVSNFPVRMTLDAHSSNCDLLLVDYSYLQSIGDFAAIDQLFDRNSNPRYLAIIEGVAASRKSKVIITRRLRKQAKEFLRSKSGTVFFEKYIAIPNFVDPMFIFSAEDVHLYEYVFGKMLVSQKIYKRFIYRLLFLLSKLKLYGIFDYLFSSTYLMARDDRRT